MLLLDDNELSELPDELEVGSGVIAETLVSLS
jgi:hypothetical protein